MKETFIVFSRLGTAKGASVSLYNLIKNIAAKIEQSVITEVSFDIQINKLLVQANEKVKKASIVPRVETNLENGNTTITASPLTPSNSEDLQQCLERVQQYIEFINLNYPTATIHYMDVINNSLDITFDEEIDFTTFTYRETKQTGTSNSQTSSTSENEDDLFSLINEEAPVDEKNEVLNDEEEDRTQQVEQQPSDNVENQSDNSTEPLEEKTDESLDEFVEQPTEEPVEEPSEVKELNEEKLSQEESSATLDKTQNKLMILDGNNVLARGYYATAFGREEEDLSKDHEGKFINANYVFLQSLERYIREYNPTHLAICWDNSNPFLENFRKKLYSEYKGTRDEKPYPLTEQLETMPELIKQINVAQFMDNKGLYEADDLVGTLIQTWRENDSGAIYIVSNDKDLYQLLDTDIYQVIKKGDKEILYSVEDFQSEYGIKPSQWIDVKAILGDKSDNIPGVSGVGEKYVYDMLKDFGSIENIYSNLDKLKENSSYRRYVTKFESQKKEADLSKYLATIVTKAKVDSIDTINLQDLQINMDEQGKEQVYERIGLSTKQKSA